MILLWSMAFLSSASAAAVNICPKPTKREIHTKLSIGVSRARVNGVLDGLVVSLDGDLALAGTALVLVVLEVAIGNLLGAHGCVVVGIRVEKVEVFGCGVEMIEEVCD